MPAEKKADGIARAMTNENALWNRLSIEHESHDAYRLAVEYGCEYHDALRGGPAFPAFIAAREQVRASST